MNRRFNLLLVVATTLIALLVTTNSIARAPGHSKTQAAEEQLRGILDALENYRLENGSYPNPTQGLQALVERPVAEPELVNWQEGGYLDRVPKDPWRRDYIYRNPGLVDPVEVYSFGSDGKPGGCGVDIDVYSSSFETEAIRDCKSKEFLQGIFQGLLKLIPVAIALIILGVILRAAARAARKFFKANAN